MINHTGEKKMALNEVTNSIQVSSETFDLIQKGKVDALTINSENGTLIFTRRGADAIYRKLIEKMNEGALSINLNGDIVHCNEKFSQLIDRPMQEIIGKPFVKFVEPSETDKLNVVFTELSENNRKIEIRLAIKNEIKNPFLLSASLIRSGHQQFYGIIITDISRQKETERRVLASEKKWRTLVENSPEIICRLDIDRRYIYVNSLFELITGISLDIVIKKKPSELSIDNEYTFQLEEKINEVLNIKKTLSFNSEFISNSGSKYFFHTILVPEMDEEGVLTSVLGISRDISKLVETEKKLLDLNKGLEDRVKKRMLELEQANKKLDEALIREKEALKKAEENVKHFQMVTEALPQIAWTALDCGTIDFFNQRWYEYTGFKEKESLNEAWISAIHKNDLPLIRKTWDKIANNQSSIYINIRIKRAIDNKYRWHVLYIVPVKTSNANIIKWIGTCTDIHEQILQTEKLDAKNKELFSINRYLDNFVHAVAHDLRTPVANLQMLATIFHKAPMSQKDKLIDSVKGNIEKLDETLKGLVQVIDTQGKKEAYSKDINVYNIIQEILNTQQEKISELNTTVKLEVLKDITVCYVKAYLASIIKNMISNALKYTKKDTPPHILIKAEKNTNGYLVLTFKDNGIGIDLDKYKDKLFQPFKRLTTQSKGLGIGLHIINTMIQKNGGYIKVTSKVGEGTTFSAFLKEY